MKLTMQLKRRVRKEWRLRWKTEVEKRLLPDKIYSILFHPKIGHVGERNSGGQDPLHFVYIPSHLYHILFEIFKNAMRATIEHAGQDALHVPSVEGKNSTLLSFKLVGLDLVHFFFVSVCCKGTRRCDYQCP